MSQNSHISFLYELGHFSWAQNFLYKTKDVLCPLLSSAKNSWIFFAGIPSTSRVFPLGSPFNFLPYLLLQLDLLSESSILDLWHKKFCAWCSDDILPCLKILFSLHMDPYCTTLRRVWMYMPAFPLALS